MIDSGVTKKNLAEEIRAERLEGFAVARFDGVEGLADQREGFPGKRIVAEKIEDCKDDFLGERGEGIVAALLFLLLLLHSFICLHESEPDSVFTNMRKKKMVEAVEKKQGILILIWIEICLGEECLKMDV